MRIALLSTLEQTPHGARRAFLRLGGRTVLAWQVDLARQLGCERILCLAEGPSPELIELQREVEQAGIQFHLVRGPLQLIGLVAADHDIVAMADGLLIDPALALDRLEDRRGILALPAAKAVAAGFERIDADLAWAGLLIARANIVEQLAEMPPDSDTISLLLRLALQAGTRRIELDEACLETGELLLADSQSRIERRERQLLDHSAAALNWAAPGNAGANLLARRLAPDALGRGPLVALVAGWAGGGAAVALGAMGHGFAGLVLLVLASFALATAAAMSAIKARLFRSAKPGRAGRFAEIALDLLAIAALTLPSTPFMLLRQLFLPLVLLGLVRLASRQGPPRWRGLWSDRSLLFSALALGAWFDFLLQAMGGVTLAALAYCLLAGRAKAITQD